MKKLFTKKYRLGSGIASVFVLTFIAGLGLTGTANALAATSSSASSTGPRLIYSDWHSLYTATSAGKVSKIYTAPNSKEVLQPVLFNNGSNVAFTVCGSADAESDACHLYTATSTGKDIAAIGPSFSSDWPSSSFQMTYSEASKKLVYGIFNDQKQTYSVYTIKTNGDSNKLIDTLITGSPNDAVLQWSPSGQEIIEAVNQSGSEHLFLTSSTGKNSTELPVSQGKYTFQGLGEQNSWSSNSATITYTAVTQTSSGTIKTCLMTINVTGSDMHKLLCTSISSGPSIYSAATGPTWSSGKTIAYPLIDSAKGTAYVSVLSSDKEKKPAYTYDLNKDYIINGFSFSPNGQDIALANFYSSHIGGSYNSAISLSRADLESGASSGRITIFQANGAGKPVTITDKSGIPTWVNWAQQ